MRGQSVILTHTLLIGFGVFFLFVIISTFVSLNSDFQEFVLENEMQQACYIIKGSVEKIYIDSSYGSPSEYYSKITVSMPESIGGSAYSIEFENSSAIIKTSLSEYSCVIGLDAYYKGRSTGGTTEILFAKNQTSNTIELRSV